MITYFEIESKSTKVFYFFRLYLWTCQFLVDTGAEINFIHPDVASAFNIELANFAGVFEKPLSFDATVLKGDYEQSIITNNLSFPCRMGCVYPMALLMLKIFTKELMTTLATFT